MARVQERGRRAVRTTVTTRRKQSNKLGIFMIVLVSLVIIIGIRIQNEKLENKLEKLEKEHQQVTMVLEEEQERTLALEQRSKYIKTKAYVEEMAKKLGLVYPDEIILKPKE